MTKKKRNYRKKRFNRETKDREDHERYGENKTRRFTRLETKRNLENRRRNGIDEIKKT